MASTASELARGLGYWFEYGGDRVSQWVEPATTYMASPGLIFLGFALLAAALTGLVLGLLVRRRFFVLLLVIGLGLAVGLNPLTSPSPWGRLFSRLEATTAGRAMRSTPRAAPLCALALAVGLGALVAWIAERVPRRAGLATLIAVGLVALQLPSLFTGDLYTTSLLRDENIPRYWQDAARAMDAGGDDTRVYETPGSDFAYYRWGGTVDPITPGLIERPYVARELVPYGSPGAADLLNALEGRLQIGTFDPQALPSLARLMGVGTVATRNDLQYERFVLPHPRAFWQTVLHAGLEAPRGFGDPAPNVPDPDFPLLNEQYFNIPSDAPDPPPVALFDVPDPRPIVRTVDAQAPLVVAGSGEGLVDAAEAGLLDPDQLIVYSATASQRDGQLDRLLDADAELMVTDSNRRAGRRWGGVQSNLGYTEQAGEEPLVRDPQDNRLDLFPGAGDDSATVAELAGVSSVQASRYGNPVSYTTEDRPANAIDGDPLTAWRTGAFSFVRGQRLRIELDQPVTTDRITLLQPVTGAVLRYITKARLRFDDDQTLDVAMDDSSRVQPGQVVDLGSPRTFKTLDIEITAANDGTLPSYGAQPGVGFAEVGIDGVRVDEVLRLPTDLLDAAGARSAEHDLTLLLTRNRIDPATPNRTDPEQSIARRFSLPTDRSFTLDGTARVSGVAPDAAIDAALGGPPPGPNATSTGRLPGDPRLRGASAIDGDPTTAWTTPLRTAVGQQLTVDAGAPITVDRLDLQVVADGEHSVPTELSIAADGGPPVRVTVPATVDGEGRGTLATIPVELPSPLQGRNFVVGIEAVREVTARDYFSGVPTLLPVSIAELGLPGVQSTPPVGRAADRMPYRPDDDRRRPRAGPAGGHDGRRRGPRAGRARRVPAARPRPRRARRPHGHRPRPRSRRRPAGPAEQGRGSTGGERRPGRGPS